MSSRNQLHWYKLDEKLSGDYYLKIPQCDVYQTILEQVIGNIEHKWYQADKNCCYAYLKNTDDKQIEKVRKLLELLKKAVLLRINTNLEPHFSNELDLCFALDFNFEKINGNRERTEIGELVYKAKYEQDYKSIENLIKKMCNFIWLNSWYNCVDYIAAIPSSSNKEFHIPDLLVDGILREYKNRLSLLKIRKSKQSKPIKDLTIEKKISVNKDNFSVEEDLTGKTVLLIDDLYQSGSTIWSAAKALKKENNILKVYGLAGVKTWSDTDNVM